MEIKFTLAIMIGLLLIFSLGPYILYKTLKSPEKKDEKTPEPE